MLKVLCRGVHTSSGRRLPKRTHRGIAALRLVTLEKRTPVDHPRYEDPLYFDKKAATLPLDENYLEEMTALYKKKRQISRDLNTKTDDKLVSNHSGSYRLPEIKPLDLRVEFSRLSLMKDAPDSVKQIFSVEYGNDQQKMHFLEEKMLSLVRKNPLDRTSLPARIAILTCKIRWYSQRLDYAWNTAQRRPKWIKQTIDELLNERRPFLLRLLKVDRKDFDSMCKLLQINFEEAPFAGDLPQGEVDPKIYRPRLGPYDFIKPSYVISLRHQWIEHHLKNRIEQIREEKLAKYSLELYNRQEQFYVKKQERVPAIKQRIQQLDKEIQALQDELDPPLPVVGVFCGSTVDTRSEKIMHADYFQEKV